MPTRHRSIFLVSQLLGGALALGAAGCAAEEGQPEHADTQDARSDGDEPALQQVHPGPRFHVAEARATGDGCPLGSFSYSPTPFNNYSIDWEFTDFGISLDGNENISVKECLLKFRLESEQPARYRIEKVISQAWATLDPGNTAKHFVRAYMQGGTPTEDAVEEQTGPYEGVVTVLGARSTSRPCVSDQWLNIGTRLVVNKTAAGLARVKMVASGWIEIFPSAC